MESGIFSTPIKGETASPSRFRSPFVSHIEPTQELYSTWCDDYYANVSEEEYSQDNEQEEDLKEEEVSTTSTNLSSSLAPSQFGDLDAITEHNPEKWRILRSYAPFTLIQQVSMMVDYKEPRETIWSFPSALLFIDISDLTQNVGFTALNERFAKLGKHGEGIEEVAFHINNYFGDLIKRVNEHGADVIKFAGDALIVVFSAMQKGDSLTEMTLRAVQCAQDIQTHLNSYSAPGFTLTLHIGISVGTISFAHLGGIDNQWEFFPFGPLFTDIHDPIQLSQSGEIVLSKEAWHYVSAYCEGEELSHNCWKVLKILQPIPVISIQTLLKEFQEPSLELQQLVRSYIAKPVYRRIDAGHENFFGELRRVSVIFINLSTGFSFDGNCSIDYNELNTAFAAMQKIILRYEAFLRQFLMDDKGVTLIAVLGVPYSHEDDPVRALNVALNIATELKILGKDFYGIGVTTGIGFCGAVGSQFRREYAVVGDVVNTSARLMVAAAQNGAKILCDEATYAAASVQFDYEPYDPIKLKGKEKLVNIYKPLPKVDISQKGFARATSTQIVEQVAAQYSNELFGRENEAQLLLKHFIEIENDSAQGAGVVIEGEAGIGKTRLIDEAITLTADQLKGKVHIGFASSMERNTPFFVFQFIYQQLLHLKEGLMDKNEKSVKSLLDKMEDETLKREMMKYIPYMSLLAPADFRMPKNSTEGVTPSDVYYRLHLLLIQLMKESLKTSYRVIIIEDAQWMDEESWKLIVGLLKLEKLLIIILMRPVVHPPPQLVELKSSSRVSVIKLKPLPESAIVDIIEYQWNLSCIPSSLQKKIFELSKGNPKFALDLFTTLNQGEYIKIEDGKVSECCDLSSVSIPDQIETLVTSSFDRLKETQKLILKVCCVFPKGKFDFEAAVAACTQIFHESNSAESLELETEFEKLIELGWLQCTQFIPKKYEYTSLLYKEVVYNMCLKTQRNSLHSAIAKFYEEQYAAGNTSTAHLLLLIIFHYEKAGQLDKVQLYQQKLSQFSTEYKQKKRKQEESELQMKRSKTALIGKNKVKGSFILPKKKPRLSNDASLPF